MFIAYVTLLLNRTPPLFRAHVLIILMCLLNHFDVIDSRGITLGVQVVTEDIRRLGRFVKPEKVKIYFRVSVYIAILTCC